MRSRTANWFICKIRYEKTMEDGLQKKVTETYVVDAVSFTEAEARIIEEMSAYISGEFEVIEIDRAVFKEIFFMDCLKGLRNMADNSVDCCITSPPYFGLRDYGVDGQIGLEKSPNEYVAKMVKVFREVYRVLKPTGTLWLNIGDCYAGGNKGAAAYPENAQKYKQGTNKGTVGNRTAYKYKTTCKDKDLIGIPWMLAFALRDKVGFYLRQDIIWHKPNPMPESVLDRCTKAHEYIFLFSKSSRYYFNHEEMQEQAVCAAVERQENPPRYGGNKYTATPDKFNRTKSGNAYAYTGKRNKRDVWTVSTKPEKSAHFAAYPKELIEPCVLAGCPNGGIILDPFMGTGTTAMVARMYGRNFIGFELNAEYMNIINKKIQVTPNMFYL